MSDVITITTTNELYYFLNDIPTPTIHGTITNSIDINDFISKSFSVLTVSGSNIKLTASVNY